MRRFLAVWGPSLIGVALASSFGTFVSWCVQGQHWYAIVPALTGAAVSFFGTVGDLIFDGPSDRRRDMESDPCRTCAMKDTRLAAVTKDRDELREALVTLQLEPAPRARRTP